MRAAHAGTPHGKGEWSIGHGARGPVKVPDAQPGKYVVEARTVERVAPVNCAIWVVPSDVITSVPGIASNTASPRHPRAGHASSGSVQIV